MISRSNTPPDQHTADSLKAMERALMPRNEAGYFEPMLFQTSSPRRMLCPVVIPDANGCVPGMICAEDFADGKTPDYLSYQPGYEIHPDSPFIENRFLYEADVLLRAKEGASNASIAPSSGSYKTAPQGAALANVHSSNPAVYAEDEFCIEPKADGLYMSSTVGNTRLANFTIVVAEHRFVHKRHADIHQEFLFRVYCKGKEVEIIIPANGIDTVSSAIKKKIPDAIINPNVPKSTALLTNYVRNMVDMAKPVQLYTSVGFERISGKWIYVHDGITPLSSNVIYDTGHTIPYATGIAPKTAYSQMLNLLTLSAKDSLIVPLMLLMHLGPLFELFREAGHIPRFITFVNGVTGSLKTSVCLCLFRLFSQQEPDKPDASFYDTKTALELKMATASSRVLLIDDFQPPVSASAGKMKLESLEMVIRYVGDQNGKARSNADLDLQAQRPPACCCVITGEDTGGSQSSLLRCLILNIAKGDIDGKALKQYQDNPLILQTHLFHFLQWCGQNAEAIIQMIRDSFEQLRDFFATSVKERRQIDTGVTLLLIARILTFYGTSICAETPETAENLLNRLRAALCDALQQSESYGKQMDPVAMYLRALFDLALNGKLSIASDVNRYNTKQDVGFERDGYWWLRAADVFPAIARYWREFGVSFPLQMSKVNESLLKNDLILADREQRKGHEKIIYSKKAPLAGRPRMLVLNVPEAQRYLEQVSDS